MALFEVFIPSTDPDGFNITARIRAESWIQALRNGLSRLGDTTDVKNIMVDITEVGIEVTEPLTGRVFRIRELGEEAAAGAQTGAPAAAAPQAPAMGAPPPAAPVASAPVAAAPVAAAPPPAAPAAGAASAPTGAPPPAAGAPTFAAPPAAAPPAAAPPAASLPATGAPLPAAAPIPTAPAPIVGAPPAVVPAPAPIVAAPQADVGLPNPARFHHNIGEEVETTRRPRTEQPDEKIGRGRAAAGRSADEILGELFEKTHNIYDYATVGEASGFILDLAMQSIPSESGAVFYSDINTKELSFTAARGPKAKEVMQFTIPMGVGIVGFCAQEGVSLAVSDVHRHPQFFAQISKKLGYETKSILCSPAQREGRVFGALELINKEGDATFTTDEVNVLNYLAHVFAEYLVNTGQTGN